MAPTIEEPLAVFAALRDAMRQMLVDTAASLDTVPADEQVALSVSLFYWTWENREALPACGS